MKYYFDDELIDISNLQSNGMVLNTVSLFSGCGGLDLGFIGNFKVFQGRFEKYFDSNPYKIVWANEIDKDAVETYKNNIGHHIICDDIKNEESHLYPQAKCFPNALEIINKWYDEGNTITFFTARESKDRLVTENWLQQHGFKYHGLVMDKPRIKDGQEYVWIDNRKVRAVTYLGTWSELTEVDAKIKVFENN